MGLILYIFVLLVLGFLMAWIAGMVSKEEMEVKTGFLIVFISGVVGLFAQAALFAVIGDLAMFVTPGINFGILLPSIRMFGKLEWHHSAIIAAIYTALMFAVRFTLSLMAI